MHGRKAAAWYCPASDAQLKANGYKVVINTNYPYDGHQYSGSWKETKTRITRVWTQLPDPEPPTQSELRENAYATEKICGYNGGTYTVDEMNRLWYEYSAEGDLEKTVEISSIIAEAKRMIRERYPE